MLQRVTLIVTAVLLPVSSAATELELPAVFSDHMVVQQDQPVKVWGWADSGRKIECSLGDRSTTATAGQQGRWSLELKALPAGGPHTLRVRSGDDSLTITDVYVGEVWLCSGQSNMAMPVSRALNSSDEAAKAELPLIRMFKVTSSHATEPQDRCNGEWTVCSPETIGGFSATAYFFGRRLHEHLDVPIGLFNSSVGGTPVEAWTSLSAQKSNNALEPVLTSWNDQDDQFDVDAAQATYEKALGRWEKRRDEAKEAGRPLPRKPRLATRASMSGSYPANLFNGKIQPLVGYGIRGAIWYQGERNSKVGIPHLYGQQLETLISDWRTRWGQGEFPFAWVQLPNYQARQTQPSEPGGWVTVREGMLKTLSVPNTGMAITVDVGEANDIHPKNKQAVGARLARWALCEVYERSTELPDGQDAMGPIYASAERDSKRMRIRFQYAGDELPEPDGELQGFAIAGADRKFHWAEAEIVGNAVEVWSKEVPGPVAVRYSWAANPIGNLSNSSGIPASPFRTDAWEE